ncbi:MAG: Sensor protein ZraS [Betaproteobacteria bacterium ADurb.Bin341]|nr:MAG: Sensor protein ZraS [Betaproteobacteria bacterium ADurb.Bin341]
MLKQLQNKILVKLIVILVVAVAAINALSALYFGQQNAEGMRDNLRQSIETLANISELGYSSLVWSANEQPLYILNTAMLGDRNVVAINIYEDENFLSSLSKDLKTFKIDPASRNRRFVIPPNEKTIRQVSAKVSYEGRDIGRFELFYTERFIDDEIVQRNINLALSLILTATATIAILYLIVKRSLIRPILKLAEVSSAISQSNDYALRGSKTSDDEIGYLVDSFNSMLQSIQSYKADLKNSMEELRRAEQKFRSIFENALEGIYQSVLEGKILTANPEMAAFLGYESADELIRSLNEEGAELYVDLKDRALFLQRIQANGSVKDFEFKAYRKDRSIIDISMNAHLIPATGEETALVEGMMKDITERKQAEYELQKYREGLEKMVKERTEDLDRKNITLNNTVQELQKALDHLATAQKQLVQSEKMAALGSLVAGVAHELNTPIGNTLLVASSLDAETIEFERAYMTGGLKRSMLEHYLSSAHSALDIMLRNVQRASELITSFKQVAIDQSSSQRREFFLAEVVSEIIITLRPAVKKTPFDIETAIPEEIEMDSFPGPLGQVLTNLINNAILHAFENKAQGSIRVEARQREGARVELKVSDDGCGIPPEHLDRIFDPFFTTKLGQGGSGLGLSIANTIVTGMLGGSIQVESTVGVGTIFTLILPTVAPAAKEDRTD